VLLLLLLQRLLQMRPILTMAALLCLLLRLPRMLVGTRWNH
jgi:hypothetical protein